MRNAVLKISDNAAEKMGNLLCEMVNNVQGEWKKPWVSINGNNACAYGTKREYNGINAFLLTMLTNMNGYKTAYFLTMNKINELGLKLNFKVESDKRKYESAFPVIYWNRYAYKQGECKSASEYDAMSDEEKEEYSIRWTAMVYNVFNLDQTNFAEVYPEKYEKLCGPEVNENHDNDVNDPILDKMIEGGQWRCPISQSGEGQAYWSVSKDYIVLPYRKAFNSAHAFYGTALHEMTHSNMKECKRNYEGGFGSTGYAQEELVAELTAAIMMNDLGLEKTIDDEHLQYCKEWVKVLKDKEAVKKVMNDILKALNYNKKVYKEVQEGKFKKVA